jgi:hypothetical protein
MDMDEKRRLTATSVLLSDEDLQNLRALAAARAKRTGERPSQGATVRALIRAEAKRQKLEAARA